ncbi:uncharacterized protein DMAD_12698 [Drosophila madeirensis]|uniref:Uncharacterized protein n=1 Tax=Drosophila madeirensis TaxID=30013 RepID=A0AAU9FHZ0_DROMD
MAHRARKRRNERGETEQCESAREEDTHTHTRGSFMQHAKWCVKKESRVGFCLPHLRPPIHPFFTLLRLFSCSKQIAKDVDAAASAQWYMANEVHDVELHPKRKS